MTSPSALETLIAPGAITPVYQPVWHLDANGASLHSVECLSRGPKGTNFESANVLFDYARLKRQESVVDRVCVATALRHLPKLPPDSRVNINVHASTLGRDPGFLDHFVGKAAEVAFPLDRLTIEIVENAPPWDTASFQRTLDGIRALGIMIALDDVGLGLSNFKMIVDVHPDYLKIDQYFIDNCHADSARRAVIRAILDLGSHFGAAVVAEGIERADDLAAAMDLGLSLFQGFLLSPPISASEINDGALVAGPRGRQRRPSSVSASL
ncbi:MAG: EAL domain-containing protein [Thermoanaerobaculia bacterium]